MIKLLKVGMPILFEYDGLRDNFLLADELKLDFIELNLNIPYCREAIEKEELGQLTNEFPHLSLTLHFYDDADFATDDFIVDAYLKILDKYLANGFFKQANIHLLPGPYITIAGVKQYIYEKNSEYYLTKLIHNLTLAQDLCIKYGVNLVIENTTIMPFMLEWYQKLNSAGFHFTYDIGHDRINNDYLFHLNEKADLCFQEFHFHDSTSTKCHLALGSGNSCLAKYFALIEPACYVVIEVKQSSDLRLSVPVFAKLKKK